VSWILCCSIQGLSLPFVEMGMQAVHIMNDVSITLWQFQPVPSFGGSKFDKLGNKAEKIEVNAGVGHCYQCYQFVNSALLAPRSLAAHRF
jgi:hypothetical protein